MIRDTLKLNSERYDILIIGGGIHGATLAWDAALRGLRIALIEKSDFGAATSSNSLKIIHGGLRYLQHADFKRMRESIVERRILLSIAPHLVFPMPCLMPTFGHGIKGPEVMRIAMLLNDIISLDRNKNLDSQKHIPRGRIFSRDEFLEILPQYMYKDFNGAASWYDAHMINSERLLLSFLHSAVSRGAVIANYVKARDLIIKNNMVLGVNAIDLLNNQEFEIRARMTINTTGPWINDTLSQLIRTRGREKVAFSTAMNLVVNRKLVNNYAIGLPSQAVFKDSDSILNKGSRLLFFVPSHNSTVIGTSHKPYYETADNFTLKEKEIDEFLNELNSALPQANVKRDEITHIYAGLLPMSGVNPHTGDVQLEKHFHVIDHQKRENLEGLISVLTVKYTTARGVSESALNFALKKLNIKVNSQTSFTQIWGGDIDDYARFQTNSIQSINDAISHQSKIHLIQLYGTKYTEIIKLCKTNTEWKEPVLPGFPHIIAEIIYAIRHEMAQHLADILFRRMDIGIVQKLSANQLISIALIAAKELGWDERTMAQEIKNVEQISAMFS